MSIILEVINFKKHAIYKKFRQESKELIDLLLRIEKRLNTNPYYLCFNEMLEPIMPMPKKLFKELKKSVLFDKILKNTKLTKIGDETFYVISIDSYRQTTNEFFFNEFFSFFKQRGYFKDESRQSLRNKILNLPMNRNRVSFHAIYHDFLHFLLNSEHDEIARRYSGPAENISNKEYVIDMNAILDEIIVFFIQGSEHSIYKRYDYLPNEYVMRFFFAFAVEFMKFLIAEKHLSNIGGVYLLHPNDIEREVTSFILTRADNPKNKYVIIMTKFIIQMLKDLRPAKIKTLGEFIKWCLSYVDSVKFLKNVNDVFRNYLRHSNVLELEIFETLYEFNKYVLNLAKQFAIT